MTTDSKQRLHGQIDRVAQKSELDRTTLLALIQSVANADDTLGELILIVEDNEATLTLLRDVLGAHGYRVLGGVFGRDGLTLARAERPQLILMDVQLPGMDGLAALRALRAEPETARTPVIAVTALAMRDDRDRLLAGGFDGYLEAGKRPRTSVVRSRPPDARRRRHMNTPLPRVLVVDDTAANVDLLEAMLGARL